MSINLTDFCHADPEAAISKPFSKGGYTYATNGWMLIRCEGVFAEENSKAPKLTPLPFDHENISDWQALPAYSLDSAKKCRLCGGIGTISECPECEGFGEVELENGYNDYTCECKTCRGEEVIPSKTGQNCRSCDGTGLDLGTTVVQLGNRNISVKTLMKISTLPGVKISEDGTPVEPYRFIFDGGVGMVMPCFDLRERKVNP